MSISSTPSSRTPGRSLPSAGAVFLHLLAGLPALAAAGVMAYLLWIGARMPLTTAYQGEAKKRWNANQADRALVCFRRLAELEPNNLENRFYEVLALDRLGKPMEAEVLARSLAPADHLGFPRAHFWLANRLLADRGRYKTDAVLIEGHLLRFLQFYPKADEAKATLGKLYLLTGRAKEARAKLEEVAGDRPERLIDLARACRATGDEKEASLRAKAALDVARRRAESKPDDKVARLLWADASVLLEDYPGALRILELGDKLTGDGVFKKTMASVCNAWAASMLRSGKGTPAERLAVIQMGLKNDANNVDLLNDVTALMMQGDGKTADEAREAIRAALASGKAPAMAHFALGNDAWARGKIDEARSHWEQAYRLNPTLAISANNLAWLLAFHEPADVPRGRALIEEALKLSPNDPRLRGTHGQILAKMDKWKDGIQEMEYALATGFSSSTLHESLAQAYDHVGDAKMAEEHRKLAKP